MKIRIMGAGWYGCHIGLALRRCGHEVEIHDIADRVFAGASGGIPARLHQGFHYPRSRMTRAACQEHAAAFMERYGFLTRGVPINLYAIAIDDSMVDFDQYVATLAGEVPFIRVHDPAEFGLCSVEGAILTGERHILTDAARAYFEDQMAGCFRLGIVGEEPGKSWDWTVDCTFGANDASGVDRYEPCVVALMQGAVDKAVTVMDGPFASLYPWDAAAGLCSLSSARWTPFSKTCKSWREAKDLLDGQTAADIRQRVDWMIGSMARYFPAIRSEYELADFRLSVRAMPLSGADTRLVDVRKIGTDMIRVRAGKIDAVIHAEREIMGMIR